MSLGREEVIEALRHVYDPDYKGRSIVDMGLVDENSIKIEKGKIYVEYGLTAPLCPFSSAIGVMIKHALARKFGAEVEVRLSRRHLQAEHVNEILKDEEKCEALIKDLKGLGILQRCIKM